MAMKAKERPLDKGTGRNRSRRPQAGSLQVWRHPKSRDADARGAHAGARLRNLNIVRDGPQGRQFNLPLAPAALCLQEAELP